jgi:hypothetical protein
VWSKYTSTPSIGLRYETVETIPSKAPRLVAPPPVDSLVTPLTNSGKAVPQSSVHGVPAKVCSCKSKKRQTLILPISVLHLAFRFAP